jgi:hypothetical protein
MHSTYLTKNNMTVIPHPPYLSDLTPCDFSVSPTQDETVTSSQNTASTIYLKMEEALGTVHTHGRRLLRG